METEIIVNVQPRETRVGILEDGRLTELHVERGEKVVGNIYKGRVEQVVTGLDAAFVDVGLERNVFIHIDDALDEEPDHSNRHDKSHDRKLHIREVIKEGQEIVVQVTKGPVGTKGARVTSRISLPGKYSVLMAQARRKVGVSRKIQDEKEREALRELGEKVRPKDFGMIVRTQAAEVGLRELQKDVLYLERLWNRISETAAKTQAPALLHEELSLSQEVLRDVFNENAKGFVIDDKKAYRQILDLLTAIAPRLKSRVSLYEGEEPIFEKYGIESEIQKALGRKVWLGHGGYLIIDTTEALTVIDVNTGKFTGAGSLEETILHTNLDAAMEISRQLRLRDIGGIIVIDFIDMERQTHQRRVMAALRESMKRDRVRTRVLHLTPLGLVEMTRQRTGRALAEKMNVPCPACGGEGEVLSPESVCINIEASLRRMAKQKDVKALQVIAHPTVALHFIGEGGEQSTNLGKSLGKQLFVVCANRVSPETFRVEQGTALEFRREVAGLKPGKQYTIRPDQIVTAPWGSFVAVLQGYPIALQRVPERVEETGCDITLVSRQDHLGVGRYLPPGRRPGPAAMPPYSADAPERTEPCEETLVALPPAEVIEPPAETFEDSIVDESAETAIPGSEEVSEAAGVPEQAEAQSPPKPRHRWRRRNRKPKRDSPESGSNAPGADKG